MLNDEDFGSDTDDDDYVPQGEGEEVSEEENSGEDEGDASQQQSQKKSKKKKITKKGSSGTKKTFGRGAFTLDEAESAENKNSWQQDIAKEQQEAKEEEQKKKANDIWADFKSSVKSQTAETKPTTTAKPLSTNLFGDLFKDSSSSAKMTAKPAAATTTGAKDRFSALFDVGPKKTEEDSKAEPESGESSASKGVKKPASLLSSLFEDDKKKSDAKSCGTSNAAPDDGKMEITKEFDFAGEVVKITKSVDVSSSEAQKFIKQQEAEAEKPAAVKRSGGLANIVGSIGKKPKMGCLDKSKLDWEQYVEEEGIKDELKTHNKGKDGYVEKQLFLERADLRQFEVEKAIREKTRKTLMK